MFKELKEKKHVSVLKESVNVKVKENFKELSESVIFSDTVEDLVELKELVEVSK